MNALELRTRACFKIRTEAAHYGNFIHGRALDEYLAHMEAEFTDGDALTWQAMANILDRPIHVHTDNPEGPLRTVEPLVTPRRGWGSTTHIARHGWYHYEGTNPLRKGPKALSC